MHERDIMHENGSYWVARDAQAYTVFKDSVSDSAYPKNPDGLSIAIARADYLANPARVALTNAVNKAIANGSPVFINISPEEP